MSYLAQSKKKNDPKAIGFVILLHVLLGYFLISGLAVEVYKKALENIDTVNIKEPEKPPELPPPPPPKLEDIPPFVPPPDVQIAQDSPPPPTIAVQSAQPTPPVAPPAQPVTAIAPPPSIPGTAAIPIARTFEVSDDDYPDASRRAEEKGVTGVTVTVGVDGKVATCAVTASSGFSRLDERACQIAQRRWRFKPATENGKPVAVTLRRSYRWQLTEGR
jgi:periplasmic protein TonB